MWVNDGLVVGDTFIMQQEFMTTTELNGAIINEKWTFPKNPDEEVVYEVKDGQCAVDTTISSSSMALEEVPDRAASLYVDELNNVLCDLEAVYHILEEQQ